MNASRRSSVVLGGILVLVGLLALAGEIVPGLWSGLGPFSWPLIVVAVAVSLFLLALLTGAPGLVIPGCIVGGIGLLLYWQNATGRWDTWAYAWALIPGFVGVGTVLLGLLTGRGGDVRGGLWLILISLVLFAIFASFLGGLNFLGNYWPLLLIVLGLLWLGESFFGFRRRRQE